MNRRGFIRLALGALAAAPAATTLVRFLEGKEDRSEQAYGTSVMEILAEDQTRANELRRQLEYQHAIMVARMRRHMEDVFYGSAGSVVG